MEAVPVEDLVEQPVEELAKEDTLAEVVPMLDLVGQPMEELPMEVVHLETWEELQPKEEAPPMEAAPLETLEEVQLEEDALRKEVVPMESLVERPVATLCKAPAASQLTAGSDCSAGLAGGNEAGWGSDGLGSL